MKEPLITLLTDFGMADQYVAAMKGVILGICPNARLVDISHEIAPFSIADGAYTLAEAWKYFPKGTIHLAVVDPGVGSERRPIVAEIAGHRFVAPDNGLLSLVLESQSKWKIREITASRYFRQPVSQTFHGRDIFAPVAANLAKGVAMARFGKTISNPVTGDFTKTTKLGDRNWRGSILKIDRFGNIITNFGWKDFSRLASQPFGIRVGRKTVTRCYSNYSAAPPRQVFAIAGSTGYVEISMREASAAAALGAKPGGEILLNIR